MELAGYHLDLQRIIDIIKEKKAKTVAVQIPEGLRRHAQTLVDTLEKKTGTLVMLCADPCYGACDLAADRLRRLNIDLVVHVGHTEIPILHSEIPTVYANAVSMRDSSAVVAQAVPHLVGKRIGVVTTAQHLEELNKIEGVLKSHRLIPVIGKCDPRAACGQILGCDFSAGTLIQDQVDCFLFIGSGMFHPVGLALATHKPVIAADPYTGEVRREEIETLKDKLLRQRYATIALAQAASRFGIIVGLKAGQQRLDLAKHIRKLLTEQGKTSVLLLMDHCSPLALQGFAELECFISTACPRIAIDDSALYPRPMLTPVELEVALGLRPWEDYVFDQILP